MKKIIIILGLLFGTFFVTNTYAFDFPFFKRHYKSRNAYYHSKKHKNKMHKKSQRAYKNACKNKHFFYSSYGIRQYGSPRTK